MVELVLPALCSRAATLKCRPPFQPKPTEVLSQGARFGVASVEPSPEHKRRRNKLSKAWAGSLPDARGGKIVKVPSEALEFACEAKDKRPIELLRLPAPTGSRTADALMRTSELGKPIGPLSSPFAESMGGHAAIVDRWLLDLGASQFDRRARAEHSSLLCPTTRCG